MRRLAALFLLWCVVAAVTVLTPGAASAQDAEVVPSELPPGFTDGEPVGGTELPPADLPAPDPDQADGSASRAVTTRYFGDGPWNAINQATAATSRCGGLSSQMLTALVVSPIFKESSAATSPSTAPSPMTLSRWDEWNGNWSTTTNHNGNYGLYAFRNPYTSYSRAYWHPGIGIWQYDSAGVGAPFTAIERMDVGTVAGDVAAGMAARYCNPPSSVVGHGAPFTAQERRDAAWWPWWAGSPSRSCPLCQSEYDKMTGSSTWFSNISLVRGISATGGAVKRSCTLGGSTSPVECWYVDPSVGVIQGATGWATFAVDGRGSPTVAPAPLSLPFYVVKRNGKEERHWLRTDTGYDTDISGSRRLGKNERPRSNQPGSGVTWSSTSGLCDLTTDHGDCEPHNPPPPPTPVTPVPAPSGTGLRSTPTSVGGTYQPVVGDVNGDGLDDILWYAPGSAADYLWLGRGSGDFSSHRVNIDGTYDVQMLDVDGDGRDDVLFYAPDWGIAILWRSRGDGTFTSSAVIPGPNRQALVGDFDGNGADEIFWYGPGSLSDAMSRWNGSGLTFTTRTVNGTYRPFVGDFDGNGIDDIFWYAPGAAPDYLWLHDRSGRFRSHNTRVVGTYLPEVGDFDGDGTDDILWYRPGPGRDSVWFSEGAGLFSSQSFVVNDTYDPVVVDLGGDGRDDIVWSNPGGTSDLWTRWSTRRSRNSVGLDVDGPHQALGGRFSGNGGDGIFWYAAGPTLDAVWWR